jgi:hypothetical protein
MVAEHLLVLAFVGGILVEICLYSFNKIPFTCSYMPGKANLHFAFWASAIVLLPVIGKVAEWETVMLGTPLRFVFMILVLGVSMLGVRSWTSSIFRPLEVMEFNESESPLVQTLSLNSY